MSRPCCSQNCNQGRGCPHRAAVPPTRREWMWTLGFLALVLVLSTLGGCGGQSAPAKKDVYVFNGQPGWEVNAHVDPETGCQYLRLQGGRELTPRIAADGKTHMGCGKGAKP